MRWLVLLVVALICAMWQHAVGARKVLAPDFGLALLAWVMVDGRDADLLPRAWVVGLAQDLVDPGSTVFHALTAIVIALCYLPLRPYIFRKRATGWMLWAFVTVCLHTLVDRVVAGGGEALAVVLATALLTAAVVPLMGWLLGGLPDWCDPVREGGS